MSVIKGLTGSLKWVNDLLSFFQTDAIKIPVKYREQVLQTKKLLQNDTSGLINTTLDFAINCAITNYKIETNNANLTKILNNWLTDINFELRQSVPTGINALAKEYFRERWKGSSNLLLRTFWEKKDGIELPSIMFFVDGEDIKVQLPENAKAVELGKERYYIRINANPSDDILLPKEKNEVIFVQRPYETWGVYIPIPYVIRKGLFRNLKFFNLLSEKGEFIIAKALEYLFVMKKGTENTALSGRADFIYSEEDLKKVKQDFGQILRDKKNLPGTPTYATNFDTELTHLIPDYTKAINEEMYAPIEKRILAGLGLVDIVKGTGSTRRESILNPKPFIAEVEQGNSDFSSMLVDIMLEIVARNKTHPKWMNSNIKVKTGPVQHFIDDKFRAMIRSGYDRGTVSYRTFVEIGLNMDYDTEVQNREIEKKKGHDKLLYPPVIQNMEGTSDNNEDISPDKKTIEKKNFMQSLHLLEDVACPHCEFHFNWEDKEEIDTGSTICENCEETINLNDLEVSKIFEEAPYKDNKSLPKNIQGLPTGAKTIWRKAFNATFQKFSETRARKIAWSAVKKVYKKVGDDWVKKSQGEIVKGMKQANIKDLIELAKLKILGKQDKVLSKLIEEDKHNETT